MRIIIYIFFFCAVHAVGFGQNLQMQNYPLDEPSDCNALYVKGSNYNTGGNYQAAYDSLRKFVEQCANVKVFNGQEIVFGEIDGAVQNRSVKNERFVEYRDWLKSVLYLNPGDTSYYCSDVNSILFTTQYFPGTGHDYNAGLAILRYAVDSGKCKGWFGSQYERLWKETRDIQYKLYRDTVQDSIATPIDTTLPSLEDLDLTILRGLQNSVTPATNEYRLGELIAVGNPFTDILELKYRLDKSAMVRIDVYDLLGKAVYSEGQGYKAEGEYVLSLQSKGWSSGSYYVRLSSPSGEVKTVKVVKE